MSSSSFALQQRRRFLCLGTAGTVAAALAGCGFHLRGEATYPFNSIFVNAPVSPPLATELTRGIAAASAAKVADSTLTAQVILDIPSVVDDKEVLSLSSGGSVREYQLIKRVQFRLRDKDGIDWMPSGEIVIRRSYTFNETQVLARDLQEQRLLREMQTDAVQQIVRRLQGARKPI
ncbi:MAG: LPS assembly lipoprotein LptE [Casimicrobiaceae bacterium]